MSWQSDCIEMVRVLINDMNEPYKFDDCRIERVLIVASAQLVKELDFPNQYVVSISKQTITPDPTTTNPRDDDFLILVSKKTAILITDGEHRTLAMSNMRVVDGPSSIDISGAVDATKKLLDYLLNDFEKDKIMFAMGNHGYAITTPTTYWS